MSALFGKKADTKTFLLVDVENGSVATALVQLSQTGQPKLFAEHRVALPILHTISSEEIAKKAIRAIDESLGLTSEVAANIRQHETMRPMGILSGAHIFFGVPWVTTDIHMDRLHWLFEPELLRSIKVSTETVVGAKPVMHHPFARAAAQVSGTLAQRGVLVCIITGEVLELLIIENNRIEKRATVPTGLHTVLRTLGTHAGLSFSEAQSAFRLHAQADGMGPFEQTLRAASEHFVEQFSEVAKELLHAYPVQDILVIGKEPVGEWFARSLSTHEAVARLFPHGGVTRTLRPKHLMPYLAAHAQMPDVPLMAEAMFVSAHEPFI